MSACRSGCLTQDHATWGECARAANLRINAVMVSPLRDVWDKTNSDLAAYREARGDGIQPEGTTMQKVQEARNATSLLGRPYNADVDPPARMIVTVLETRSRTVLT